MAASATRWFKIRKRNFQEKLQEAKSMTFRKHYTEKLVKLDPEHPFMMNSHVASYHERSERDLVVVVSPSLLKGTVKFSLYMMVEGTRIHRYSLIMPIGDLPYEEVGDGSKAALKERYERKEAAQNLGLL